METPGKSVADRVADFIETIATLASRTPEETRKVDDAPSAQAKYLLFFAVLGTLAVLYVPVFTSHFQAWVGFRPDVSIPSDLWRALYGHFGPCGIDATTNDEEEDCPASPDNPMLWDSYYQRIDPSHVARVAERRFKDYWIGAILKPELLRRAATRNAGQLLLGTIVGAYDIYLDGVYVAGNTRAQDTNPIILNITLKRLFEDKPLYVALHIFHNSEAFLPDVLNSDSGGEGFVTAHSANTYRNFMAFWEKARPFGLMLAYGLLGGLFFFFWMSSKLKQEYFYMAMFALVSAFYQARKMDILLVAVDPETNYLIEYVVRSYVASFGMFLGLAFARSRRIFFTLGVPVALALPFLLYNALPELRFELFEAGRLWLTPALFGFGAAACYLQALYLVLRRRKSYLPTRAKRLALFGFGLFVLSFFYYAQARDLMASGVPLFWDGAEHLIFMVIMGTIALREYKQQEFLVSKAPVSEYHRRPVLPEKITGVILMADLKDSEAFYRFRAAHSHARNLVTSWRNQFYDTVYKHGGIIINKKGDELVAFFDKEKIDRPLLAAMKTVTEIASISRVLETEFRRQNLLPPNATGFYFRAALVEGDIRPVWENFGGNREAYWEEAGKTTPFVEASRLIDIERLVPTDEPLTQLIVHERVVERILSEDRMAAAGFALRSLDFQDKHGHDYTVAVFRPQSVGTAAKAVPNPKRNAA